MLLLWVARIGGTLLVIYWFGFNWTEMAKWCALTVSCTLLLYLIVLSTIVQFFSFFFFLIEVKK